MNSEKKKALDADINCAQQAKSCEDTGACLDQMQLINPAPASQPATAETGPFCEAYSLACPIVETDECRWNVKDKKITATDVACATQAENCADADVCLKAAQ